MVTVYSYISTKTRSLTATMEEEEKLDVESVSNLTPQHNQFVLYHACIRMFLTGRVIYFYVKTAELTTQMELDLFYHFRFQPGKKI